MRRTFGGKLKGKKLSARIVSESPPNKRPKTAEISESFVPFFLTEIDPFLRFFFVFFLYENERNNFSFAIFWLLATKIHLTKCLFFLVFIHFSLIFTIEISRYEPENPTPTPEFEEKSPEPAVSVRFFFFFFFISISHQKKKKKKKLAKKLLKIPHFPLLFRFFDEKFDVIFIFRIVGVFIS
jgi:hypothetical protein